MRQRDRIDLVLDAGEQSARDRERERETHAHAGAEPRIGVDLQRAPERAHLVGDDVEPDSSAGDVGDLVRRREPGARDDRDELLFRELLGRVLDDPQLLGARQHASLIDPATVVGDADQDGRAIALRRQDQRRDPRLAGFHALAGRLDPVIEGVSQEMEHRLAHLVEHRAIELDLLPFDLELHLFPQRTGGVTHHSREPLEYLPHRYHPGGHDLVLQRSHDLGSVSYRFDKLLVAKAIRDLGDAVARDDELSRNVHERVETSRVDADVPRRLLRRSRRLALVPLRYRKFGGKCLR